MTQQPEDCRVTERWPAIVSLQLATAAAAATDLTVRCIILPHHHRTILLPVPAILLHNISYNHLPHLIAVNLYTGTLIRTDVAVTL